MANVDATATTTLAHVNVPPAQTWNYLKIDSVSLTLPAPVRTGAVYARLPRIFDRVPSGIGAEGVQWVEDAAGDAHYVEVRANERRAEPIVVDVDAAQGDVADRGVIVRHGAEATIVMVSHGPKEGDTTSASLVRIIAEHDSQVHVVEVVALGEGSQHLEGVGIHADARAQVDVRQYLLGGAQVAAGLSTDLAGDGARLTLSSRYLVRGSERLDINHVATHHGASTRSDLSASGLIADAGEKTLRETINLVHGGKGAKGNEMETVLVAGDDIVNKTLPTILCDEEDVQGNHGASIGSVSPEQLSYLATRGMSEDDVTDLFARAIFDDALIHAPEATTRKAVSERAAEVLGAELAGDIADGLGLDEGK